MDYFSFFLNGINLAGQSILHLCFVGRLTEKKPKAWHYAAYFSLLCGVEAMSSYFALARTLAIGAALLALYGTSRLALKNPSAASWTAVVLAVYISQLSFGIISSAESILFSHLLGEPLLYPLLFFAMLAALAIAAGSYLVVLKLLSLAKTSQTPYLQLLLLPCCFFFAAELYILHSSYSGSASALSLEEIGQHAMLLFLQAMSLGALFCTLYAYQHICRGFQAQAALVSLTQAAKAQRVYIAEAQTRYEQTKAFRHDIKNHLSVLDGLLSAERFEESKSYLQKLEAATASLSFPYQTGNPVADILLSEKLGVAAASGIAAEASLILPQPCGIDDFDLCVIFANALDNAIRACQLCNGAKSIRISGKQQGDFYLLRFENTCQSAPLPPMGTGLSNIKTVAEKYHGTMLLEKTEQLFSLHVLLNVSLHSKDPSGVPT